LQITATLYADAQSALIDKQHTESWASTCALPFTRQMC